MTEGASELGQAIKAAASRSETVGAVEALYAEVQSAIGERGPRCEMSGRCCRFEEYGHRLFVTTIELAAFAARVEAGGHVARTAKPGDLSALILQPPSAASCPFQQDKLCTVHAIRPFGCRMFFCDPTSTEWQNDAYERFHARIKALHERFAIPYYYVEWRAGLAALSGG